MYADQQRDDVSNIHRRWSLTRFNPSSFRNSIITSLCSVFGFSLLSLALYLGASPKSILFHVPLALGAVIAAHYADFVALRGTPINKLSKVSHVAAFANILWLLTILAGFASCIIFSRSFHTADYIVAGMMLAAGLRIGIFTSVFGASNGRAIAVSFIMPLMVLFALVPFASYPLLATAYTGMIFGTIILALGIAWTLVADRAGRPKVTSTFKLLQAFLSAWSDDKVDKIEEYTDSRAHEETVSTAVLQFAAGRRPSIVLPQVHPGPFGSVGGSNLPYVLFESFNKSALVMHSASDHSLNLPSKKEVDRYVQSLIMLSRTSSGNTCTMPIREKRGNASATGIAFGDSALVILSLAPHGADDIPDDLHASLQDYSEKIGFKRILIVDSHNAMGRALEQQDKQDMAEAAKACILRIKESEQQPFSVGYANTGTTREFSQEVGQAGFGVFALGISGKSFAFGWADANNVQNGLREDLISSLATSGQEFVELCTSDTHATSGKRTREGYYPLGTTTSHESIIAIFAALCGEARSSSEPSSFELLTCQSNVKVMGGQQFEDYSKALDNSIRVTKGFLIASVVAFIAMLLV